MAIAIDKQAHAWWGWAIAATLFPVMGWMSVLVAGFMGAAKELWDKQGHGTPDIWDFAATAAGGIVGAAVCAALVAVHG